MRRLTAYLVTTALFAGAAPATAKPRVILVDRAQFHCLVRNIDRVPLVARGVFADISECQSVGVRIIRSIITPLQEPDPKGFESLLYLRPVDAKCIQRYRRSISRLVQPISNNRYRLTLPPCRLQ